MTGQPTLTALQDSEREARMRLATFRAKLYADPGRNTPLTQRRLAELERRWQGAAQRLRQASH